MEVDATKAPMLLDWRRSCAFITIMLAVSMINIHSAFSYQNRSVIVTRAQAAENRQLDSYYFYPNSRMKGKGIQSSKASTASTMNKKIERTIPPSPSASLSTSKRTDRGKGEKDEPCTQPKRIKTGRAMKKAASFKGTKMMSLHSRSAPNGKLNKNGCIQVVPTISPAVMDPSRTPWNTAAPIRPVTQVPTQQQTMPPTLAIETDRPTAAIMTNSPTTFRDTPVSTPFPTLLFTPTISPGSSLSTTLPTMGSSRTAEPTSATTAPASTSFQPTSGGDNAPTSSPTVSDPTVEITPFLIEYYTTAQTEGKLLPTARDFARAAKATQSYLETYLFAKFGSNAESFEPVVLSFQFDPVWGLIFAPTITFSSSLAPSYPSAEEVDAYVQQAFSDPFVSDLISELQALDVDILFRTTEELQYSVNPEMIPEIATASPSPLPIISTPVILSPDIRPRFPSSTKISGAIPRSISPTIVAKSSHSSVHVSFKIEYGPTRDHVLTPQDELPVQIQCALTASITMRHLENFLTLEFNRTFGVFLDAFNSQIISSSSETILTIAYEVNAGFLETSAFIPSVQEMSSMVELAFSEPTVKDLIHDLREFPANVLSQATQSITYGKYVAAEPNDDVAASSRLAPWTDRADIREKQAVPLPTKAPGAPSSQAPSAAQEKSPSYFPSVSSKPTHTFSPTTSTAPSYSSSPTALNSVNDLTILVPTADTETDSTLSLQPSVLYPVTGVMADSTFPLVPFTHAPTSDLSAASFPSKVPFLKFNPLIPPPKEISASDEKVRATPFLIEYMVDTQMKSLQQWHAEVLEVDTIALLTMKHLETFLIDQFYNTFGVSLELFGSIHMDRTTDESSLAIAFAADMVFDGRSSTFIPTTEEVDQMIELAFMEPPLLSLIHQLHGLPQEIPFRETVSILYFRMPNLFMEGRDAVAREENGNGLFSPASFIVLAGGSILIFLLACCALWRHQTLTRCSCVTTSTDSILLKNSKAEEGKTTMPSHSFGESFLKSQLCTDVGGNSFVVGNNGTGSQTVSSSSSSIQSRFFNQLSVASVASETIKMMANLPIRDRRDGRLNDSWSDAPVTSRRFSSSSPSTMSSALTAAEESSCSVETNFNPPSLPRSPVDPPDSQQPRQRYSSKLDIRVI